MGFVIGLKSIGLDADDYKYFLLKGEDGQEHYQNQIRIACKSFEVMLRNLRMEPASNL